MHVAVLIVAYGNAEDVGRCLKALAQSSYSDFSVHIVENAGPHAFDWLRQQVGDMATGFPLKLHLAPDNLGFAGGNNYLIERAGSWDALWVLNPDTEPAPQALSALVDKLSGQGGYGIVGGRLVNPASGLVQLYAGRWRKWRGDGFNIGRNAPAEAVPDTDAIEREMSYVNGACMLVSRAFVEVVGLMEEDYFLYCEEVDWCLRRGRFRLGYAHEALILHAHGSTIGSSLNRKQRSPLAVYLTERNRLLLTRRRFPAIYPATVLIALALIARNLKDGAWGNFRVALRGWRDGLKGLSGPPTQKQINGR